MANEATNTSTLEMFSQLLQLMQNSGVNLTGSSGLQSVQQGNTAQLNMDKYSSPATWNMSNINQAIPAGTSFSGNIIPLGTPEHELTAQDIADMTNEAVRIAQSGGYGVPNPPEYMPADTYTTFLSTLENLRNQMQVEQRANQALGAIQSEYAGLKSSPLLSQAEKAASETGTDWDMYNTMRGSLDANYNRAGAAQNAASRGLAGSSFAQLADNQARANYAGQVANLYPQSQQASEALRSSTIQRLLQPYYAQQATSKDYLDSYNSALRAMFGQPEFVLNS